MSFIIPSSPLDDNVCSASISESTTSHHQQHSRLLLTATSGDNSTVTHNQPHHQLEHRFSTPSAPPSPPPPSSLFPPSNCYLLGIELYNFKSYHGHHLVGPFTELTAIIGPNGSGKSNLMDAICFALLMQSNKLRAKNLAKLINDGTEGGNSSFSSSISNTDDETSKQHRWVLYVKLIFKSRTATTHQTVSIKRGILEYNRNQSEYLIDDRSCTKSEYENFLKQLGFNVKNKIFLIFQNTLEQMVMKSPKDFTAIMEEISGSAIYKAKYDALKTQCNAQIQELHLLNSRKQTLMKNKQFYSHLNRQSTRSVVLNEEIANLKLRIMLIEFYWKKCTIEETTNKLTVNNEQCQALVDELNHLRHDSQSMIDQVTAVEMQKQVMEGNVRQLELQMMCQSRHHLRVARDELNATRKRLAAAQRTLQKLTTEQQSSDILVQTLREQTNTVRVQYEQLQQRLEQQSARFAITDADVAEYKRLKDEYYSRTTTGSIITEVDDVHKQLDEARLKLSLNAIKQGDCIKERERLNATAEILTKEQRNNDELIQKLSHQLTMINTEEETLKQKCDSLKRNLHDSLLKLSQCKKLLKDKYVNSTKKHEHQNKKEQIKYLQQTYGAKRVLGRVTDLLVPIHARYHVPVRAVMQKSADAIVVDSMVTLSEIMSNECSLKANFLPLDFIRAPPLREQLRCLRHYPQVKLMFDLVRIPKDQHPSLEKVARYVFHNTLVCANGEEAAQVAYNLGDGQYHDAISIEGEYYRANGQIVANYTSAHSVTSWEVEDYEEECLAYEKLQKQHSDLQELYNTINDQLVNVNRKRQSIITQHKLAKALLDKLNKQRNENQQSLDNVQQKLVQLGEEEHQLKVTIEQVSAATVEHQELLVSIERQVYGDFLQRLHFDTVQQFEESYYSTHKEDLVQLNQLSNELCSLEDKLKKEEDKQFQVAIERWIRVQETEMANLAEKENTVAQCEQRYNVDENALKTLKEKLAEFVTQLAEMRKRLLTIDREVAQLSAKRESLKKAVIHLQSTLRRARKERHELYRNAYLGSMQLPISVGGYLLDELFPPMPSPVNRDGEQRHGTSSSSNNDDDNSSDTSNAQQMPALPELNAEEQYELEDQIELDFDLISDLLSARQSMVTKAKLNLELELQRKEEESHNILLSMDANIANRLRTTMNRIRENGHDIDRVRDTWNRVNSEFNTVKHERIQTFVSFLDSVNSTLGQLYKQLMQSDSSQAFLVPENSEEPYLEGVHFNCIVPGKQFQPISCLSGGEKSLAAFAFLFSTYAVDDRLPTFFILDEIDAPLDNVNIGKFITFIRGQMSRSQFILISHKLELFSLASSLIGVTRENTLEEEEEEKDHDQHHLSHSHRRHCSVRSKTISLDLRPYDD